MRLRPLRVEILGKVSKDIARPVHGDALFLHTVDVLHNDGELVSLYAPICAVNSASIVVGLMNLKARGATPTERKTALPSWSGSSSVVRPHFVTSNVK